jgi:hypothetical protein
VLLTKHKENNNIFIRSSVISVASSVFKNKRDFGIGCSMVNELTKRQMHIGIEAIKNICSMYSKFDCTYFPSAFFARFA